jgi:hypothetical protein
MLRVLKFQIDWTPIAYATLASIKVHDACDNMVLMASNRFMKQIMNAHCTISAIVRQSGLVFVRTVTSYYTVYFSAVILLCISRHWFRPSREDLASLQKFPIRLSS